jgi:hypothetical protein
LQKAYGAALGRLGKATSPAKLSAVAAEVKPGDIVASESKVFLYDLHSLLVQRGGAGGYSGIRPVLHTGEQSKPQRKSVIANWESDAPGTPNVLLLSAMTGGKSGSAWNDQATTCPSMGAVMRCLADPW